MKLKIFITICLASLGFSSCIKNNSMYYYLNEPAIVVRHESEVALKTAWGTFYLTDLSDTIINGDCLWTNFSVDTDKQPDKHKVYLYDLSYTKIGVGSVQIMEGNMWDEFNDSIAKAELYVHYIDKVIFFGFEQKSGAGKYEYELICNIDSLVTSSGQSTPKLFLKSKKIGESGTKKQYYGFDMTEFVNKYVDKNSNKVSLYLYYKSGVGVQRTDIYTSFQNSPIYWQQ
ncbi:MAG: hypothetical protein LBC98_05720 [Prevotellaceae bacterium]|jgi:hypothetical protein|nr:hypothetical protein [Prevotellaceae bacterium]